MHTNTWQRPILNASSVGMSVVIWLLAPSRTYIYVSIHTYRCMYVHMWYDGDFFSMCVCRNGVADFLHHHESMYRYIYEYFNMFLHTFYMYLYTNTYVTATNTLCALWEWRCWLLASLRTCICVYINLCKCIYAHIYTSRRLKLYARLRKCWCCFAPSSVSMALLASSTIKNLYV